MRSGSERLAAIVATLVAVAVLSCPAWSATLQVPAQFATIQEAIDAAVPGDVVEVSPGVYSENLTFAGKAIRVTSSPAGAVIDGGSAAPCVTFDNGEGADSVLDGFDLVNGAGMFLVTSTYGGGVYCNGAGPTIQNNRFLENWADLGAGLAAIGGGEPVVIGNRFEGNGAGSPITRGGGGVFVEGPSGGRIEGNTLDGNLASHYGSGIFLSTGASCVVIDNELSENHVMGGLAVGGALAVVASEPRVESNRIIGNRSDFVGGGLLLEDALGDYIENDILENSAIFYGGGVRIAGDGFAPVLTGNRILDNNAGAGAGIFCENVGGATITRCEISSNDTVGRIEGGGGGIYLRESSQVFFTENEVIGNTTPYGGGGLAAESSTVTVRLCRFEDNVAMQFGGGVYSTGSTVELRRCSVLGNQARGGGGIGLVQSESIQTSLLVAGNTADVSGGGMLFDRTSSIVTNVTCAFNTAGLSGGGMQISGTSETRIITNSIFWGDTAPQSPEIADGSPGTFLTFCNVQGGWSGNGNVDLDPGFVDGSGGDLRLRLGSPLLDIGDPSAPEQDAVDFEGEDRVIDGDLDGFATIDIGADEAFPVVASRFGTVNAGAAPPGLADVLLVNGSAGDRRREIALATGEAFTVSMVPPPAGPNPAAFVLYVYPEAPDSSTVTSQPFGLGTATFPTPLNRQTPQQYAKIWNNLGFTHRLGAADFPSMPAPSTVLDLPNGVGIPVRVTFQGFIQDQASAAAGPASLTNAVVLIIGS